MQAVKSDSPGTSLSWLCDLGKVTSPLCALVSVPEMEPTTTQLLWELELDIIIRKQSMAHGKRSVNQCSSLLRIEMQFLQSLIVKPDGIHEAKLNLNKGFPLSLPPSSCCLFSQVCLLKRTLPCFVPSAYELSQTSYLTRLLKNWLLRVMVTHVHFHQWIRGHCSSFDISFIQ